MTTPAKLWVEAKHRLGESIIWHAARQCYFWVDLLDPALHAQDPVSGKVTSRKIDLPPPIGSIAATSNPDVLVLAHRGGLSLLDIRTMALTFYCDPEGGRDAIIYNDIKVDRWGRLWVGTSHEKEQDPRGALWCVASATKWALADAGFAVSNGPAFSLDGRTMYFNDSAGRKTLAYDIAPDTLSARNRRVFVAHEPNDGMPDGVVIDSVDTVWMAQWAGGCVLGFDREARLLSRITLPAVNVTTLCFGGTAMDQMVITTATDGVPEDQLRRFPLTGSLFVTVTSTPGVAEPLFDP